MATQKKATKKRKRSASDLAGLGEFYDREQVERLTARLAERDWRDQSLRGPDYTRLDQLLEEHGDGEAAADVFISEMADQNIEPLSARRLFVTTPNSLPEACQKLNLNTPALELLHEGLVAHGINPAFRRGDLIWAFIRIFCDETADSADFSARLGETVEKLDAWRRREQERTLLACPKCGSSRLSRVETLEVVHPLQAVWQDGNGDQEWEDLDDYDDPAITGDGDEDDPNWGRGGEWTNESWFNGILCDDCRKEFKPDQLDQLVPAAKQPSNFAGELIEPLPDDDGWAREEKFPGEPTIEALLDDAERQVRGWWSDEISNVGLGPRARGSDHWFYRVEKRQILGRPMPPTLGAFITPRSYREAAGWAAGAEASVVVFAGHHVDRPDEQGMVLIAIRPQDARTRWIPMVPDPDPDETEDDFDADDESGGYLMLSENHEDVEPVEQTRPLVELVQQKLRG